MLKIIHQKDQNILTIFFLRTAGTVALKIAYGYQNESNQFKALVKDTEDALRMFAIAALPGVFLVDTLPIRMLIYL